MVCHVKSCLTETQWVKLGRVWKSRHEELYSSHVYASGFFLNSNST